MAASLISPWLLWWPPAESHYNIYDHSVVGYVSHAHSIVLLYSVGNKITTTTVMVIFISAKHRLQRKPLVNDTGMHHDTCVTHVPWCMLRSLTRGGGEKRFRHSQRMRNPQFYVSGKRPISLAISADFLIIKNRNWIQMNLWYEISKIGRVRTKCDCWLFL